jgi:hypothetical protein
MQVCAEGGATLQIRLLPEATKDSLLQRLNPWARRRIAGAAPPNACGSPSVESFVVRDGPPGAPGSDSTMLSLSR